jgi:hypothetical protein
MAKMEKKLSHAHNSLMDKLTGEDEKIEDNRTKIEKLLLFSKVV